MPVPICVRLWVDWRTQVERVLNQLHLAESLGLPPFIYLGRKVMAAPDTCDVGENQYFDAAHGANVWEYYFEQARRERETRERDERRETRERERERRKHETRDLVD